MFAVAAAAVAVLAANTWSAEASEVWNGDASQGTKVFGNLDCASPGSVTPVAGTDGHGTVFRYTKAVGVYRCESRGIRVDGSRYQFADSHTYWFGWQQRFAVVPTGSDWVPWQWKSYPDAEQDYPLLMTVSDGKLNLVYVGPGQGWKYIWSKPVTAYDWNRVAIGIHTSSSASAGSVELYYNGVRQTFTNGSTNYTGRTWDSANEPKWGVYDRGDTTHLLTNWVDGLKLGTTYADVS
ncbi:polysaccharide lyase [Streptomyces sp. PTM05]|uniref:Polysaccharide lyase n=1 Tax=Streptantibioticus parmotrematis TaxID=2873249 RepID=A0ABS7QL29_9ACTN|nr:heparin lyase I family protein [Streptantibioticus parmotrematis]MBY8883883.1 polysaccharide lyase [Streptantibioticus parmotrematis]